MSSQPILTGKQRHTAWARVWVLLCVSGVILVTTALTHWAVSLTIGTALFIGGLGMIIARRAQSDTSRLASLVNYTPNALFITNASSHITWVNKSFTYLCGYALEQVQGQKPEMLVMRLEGPLADYATQQWARMHAAISARRPFRETVYARSKEGRLFTAVIDGAPLDGDDAYMWMLTDVHEQEVARRRLESRARILEAISDRSSLRDFLLEVAETLETANPSISPLIALIDQHTQRVSMVVAPAFSEPALRLLIERPLTAEGPCCTLPAVTGKLEAVVQFDLGPEWQALSNDLKAQQFISCWSMPAVDAQFRVVACVAAFSRGQRPPNVDELALVADATDLVGLAIEKRAIELENRTLRFAMQAADDAVLVVDETGRIRFENEALSRSFTSQSMVGKGFSEFARRYLELDPAQSLEIAVANTTSWRGRLSSRKSPSVPDAKAAREENAWFDISVTPIGSDASAGSAPFSSTPSRSSKTEGVLVTFRDVTQQVRDEHLQSLSVEGEKAKAAVAWAMSVDAPLPERCSAALASVFQMQGLDVESRGAIYLRDPAGEDFDLFCYCGNLSEELVKRVKVRAGHGLAGTVAANGQMVVTDDCLQALTRNPGETVLCDTPHVHGHYVVPLMERPDHALGLLVLSSGPRPIRDAPRLEALALIAEIFATAVLRDRAERSLIESSKQAEDASRAKSDFLATMSHEIRTPMNGVLGFTQLLLDSNLSRDQRDNAQLIFNSAEALLALLNDILDFSKIEAGKLVIDPRPTAIIDSAREAVGLIKANAERKGVTVSFSAASDVPTGILIDAMRFRQVLLNLTGNAVKFTPSGSVDVSLSTVSLADQAKELKVCVKDTGIGIAANVLPNLFGKFVQADTSTSRRFGGTGLGLAISKRLVELMGGTITAESEEGRGSTFTVVLPMIEAVVEGARAMGEARNTPLARHRRVLLAEDNLVNQTLARKVLEKMSAEVTVAPNGVEAVRLATTQEYDVILMDCQMPEMDGYDATRAIREWEAERRSQGIPIIAITANAFADDIERCLTSGMDAVLTKPFKLRDLETALEKLDRRSVIAVSA